MWFPNQWTNFQIMMRKIFLFSFPLLLAAGQPQLRADSPEAWAGTYELSPSTTIHIEQNDDGWTWRRAGADPLPMVFDGPTAAEIPDAGIRLRLGGDGDARRLYARRYGETVRFPRPGSGMELPDARNLPALIDAVTPRLMLARDVPGVSVALVRRGEISWLGQYGVTQHDQDEKVGPETVFEAASMSKPFFAYMVLQLVEEGAFDLDTPLVEYFGGPYIDDDHRHEQMTGRMVLSHSGGFPNWRPGGRSGGGPIPVRFDPGTGFTYSGEGFWFIQRSIENMTGQSLAEMSRERLLDPLGMSRSSYVWLDEYDKIASAGHTAGGLIPERNRPIYRSGNSAFSLYTTPEDYAKFLIEMMNRDRSATHSISIDSLRKMLTPITLAEGRSPIERSFDENEGEVHFGLGWRVEKVPSGTRYLHSGSNRAGFRCYSEFNPATGNGIVIMTNSAGGQHVWQELMRHVGEI